jgi:hypothetical protein
MYLILNALKTLNAGPVRRQFKNSDIHISLHLWHAQACLLHDYPEGLPDDWGSEGEAGLPIEIRKI